MNRFVEEEATWGAEMYQPGTVQWWHGYGQGTCEMQKGLNAQQKR